jgi:hypothetical protein
MFPDMVINVICHLFTGLPFEPDVAEFDRVWAQQHSRFLHPVTLLVAFLRTQDEVCDVTVPSRKQWVAVTENE